MWLPEAPEPWPPVCWPQLALDFPGDLWCPPSSPLLESLSCSEISLTLGQERFHYPQQGLAPINAAEALTLHFAPSSSSPCSPRANFLVLCVPSSAKLPPVLSLKLRCFSLCFVVGNEQNGLDFNRQVRSSLASQGFSSFLEWLFLTCSSCCSSCEEIKTVRSEAAIKQTTELLPSSLVGYNDRLHLWFPSP